MTDGIRWRLLTTICRFVRSLLGIQISLKMKRLLFAFCMSVAFSSLSAQTAASPVRPTGENEVLLLKETNYNFGRIAQGKPVTHIFEVVNTSKEPLLIENVQASCGCTTPEWSKEPIAPGASSKITVGYNAAAEGEFEKSISIFYKNGKMKTVLIRGNVWKAPDQSAPLNSSLTLIKNLN